MIKNPKILAVILLLTLLLVACGAEAIQTVEVTRLVPQTIEVTRLVPPAGIATHANQAVVTITPKPEILATADSLYHLDRGYYDGIVVITQYYTLLGHNLYNEAYQLLGSSAKQHSPNLEDYVSMARQSFKAVEIVTIEPCTVWLELQGGHPRPDSESEKCFAVEIRAWGEGGMSGSVISGELQLLFLTLVLENGEWKIDSFATGLAQ